MTHSTERYDGKDERRIFEIDLRTGQRPDPVRDIETKFNPWHDPDDGGFTFAGGGIYTGPGSTRPGSRRPRTNGFTKPPTRRDAASRADEAIQTDIETARQSPSALDDPRNVSFYVVISGDNLTRIAATRKGLRVTDLAWLNGLPVDGALRIGQRLKVPTQAYLEAGKGAQENFQNLEFYRATHGGKLPPDVAHVPSILTQIDTEMETVSRDGIPIRSTFF